MTILLLGLILFLGVHSVRIVADNWRTQQIASGGLTRWKVTYALLSALGLALIIWGYGLSRAEPVVLWIAPLWTRHLAALLMLASFILLAATYVPGSRIKAKLHHPMVLAVKVWALAHLLANGTLADLLLFGSFLLWAAMSFRAARGRDRAAGTVYAAGTVGGDVKVIVVGILGWAVFAGFLHAWLIGVRPFG